MRIRLYLPSEDNEDYYPHHFSYDGDRYETVKNLVSIEEISFLT